MRKFSPAEKMRPNWDKNHRIAVDEIGSILERLPELLGQETKRIPVIFDKVPSRLLMVDGIEPETLGFSLGRNMRRGKICFSHHKLLYF